MNSHHDTTPQADHVDAAWRDIEHKWKTVKQAADRVQVGPKLIYREIAAGRLRAARVGGRREYRTTDAWIDDWLEASAAPVEMRR